MSSSAAVMPRNDAAAEQQAARRPRPWRQSLRLLRTTSFRITMLYAGVFIASVALLLVTVYSALHAASSRMIDRDVRGEIHELFTVAPPTDLAKLTAAVSDFTFRSPDMHYLLQDRGGKYLAGDMRPIDPVAGMRVVTWFAAPVLVRGRGVILPGGYLFIGVNDTESSRLAHAMARTFLLCAGMILALGLGGGVLFSASVLRRLDLVNRASVAIIAGDLGRRIPLRGTNDEFDQLGMVLNTMLDRIQTLMSGLQQVSNDIAHDLRTPLTRMRQRLELALRRETTVDGLKETLGRSIEDLDAILGIFAALLRIAQIESGSRRAEFAPVDLPSLIAAMIETYQPVAEETGHRLGCACAALPPIHGDRALLGQLIVNLIENALRHTPSGTVVEVSCALIAARPTLIVADRGPGIPPALRAAALLRFVRLDRSRSQTGSGLGFAMVSAIAGLHDATLRLDDNHPGLRVTVAFPPTA